MLVLKKRREFVRLNTSAVKVFQRGFVLQVLSTPDHTDRLRIGFTATKRIGNAVTRNRAKRRLRALWHQTLQDRHWSKRLQGYDIVLIAKAETPTLPYQNLLQSLQTSLRRGISKATASKNKPIPP